MATVSRASATATVLLGNGQGDFSVAPGSPFSVGRDPSSVVTGDFDKDGIPDLVVVPLYPDTGREITFWRGDGAGQFTVAGKSLSRGVASTGAAAGDIDGDGNLDLFVTGGSGATLLGNGAFGFQIVRAAFSMLPGDPLPPVLADFDKDGKLDFATGYSNSGIVDIGINAGGGRFNVQNSATGYLYLVPVGERATPMGLAVGDLNQDGWPDLAVSAGLSARGLFFSGIVTLLGPKGGNPQTRRCLLDQT